MKKFLVIAVITLAASPVVHPPTARASDKGTYCQSTGVTDAGYSLNVASDFKTAVLSEESIMGPRKVADMDCQLLPVVQYPDSLNNYLLCRDGRISERGLIARVFSGGIAAVHYASLRTVKTVRGQPVETEVQFGHLNCRQ